MRTSVMSTRTSDATCPPSGELEREMHAGTDGFSASDTSHDPRPESLPGAKAPLALGLAGLAPDARVTIVRTGGLGDTILVLPTVETLRAAYPSATFALVGSVWAEALHGMVPGAVQMTHVDRAFLSVRRGGNANDLFAASDAVIVYTATPDSELVAHARSVCPGPLVVWPVTPAPGIHAARHLANAVLPASSGPDPLPRPSLECPPAMRFEVREWLERHFGRGAGPVAVHPGSGGRRKCWPARRFAECVNRLAEPVILVEGPADAEACRECAAAIAPSLPVVRATEWPLPRLAALLTESRAYLGNDSGVSHFAAALGAPTVVVFGPTDPAVWAPLGSSVSVVAPRGDEPWPTVDGVLCAVRTLRGDGTPRPDARGAPR